MIMYTYHNLICITNRHLCNIDFLQRIEQICKRNPKAIVLREKDLKEDEYKILAMEVIKICDKYSTDIILHNFIDTAISLNQKKIHLPLWKAKKEKEKLKYFDIIGISTHSTKEAIEAKNLGATYITAGHIFETDCKKGLKGRGLDFLKEVTECVDIPVYAIGGINKENIDTVINMGAKGACIMSGFMKGKI